MTWYQYRQNNSGGYFADPAINVVVEATGKEAADEIAIAAGVDTDAPFCECCGNRWSLYADETETKPDMVELFGSESHAKWCASQKSPRALYVHADGTREVAP